MIRALFLLAKIGLLVAIAIWVAEQQGAVNIRWQDYNIDAHIGIVLAAILLLVLIGLAVQRVFLSFVYAWRLRKPLREKRKIEKGLQALTSGLSAIAAGDHRQAALYSRQTHKYLPAHQGLPLLLDAQTARIQGDRRAARKSFEQLLKHKDTTFLGLRGLLATNLETGDTAESLTQARKALKAHPKNKWVLQTVYQLELKERQWANAWDTLQTIEKREAMSAPDILSDKTALLMQLARLEEHAGRDANALKKRRQAHKLEPSFAPAAIQLIQDYIELGKLSAARKTFETCWKLSPHPDLVPFWSRFAPGNKPKDPAVRLRWFEKLLSLYPDDPEGHMAAAGVAIDDRLWGEAREHLRQAETYGAGHARFYRLWAHLEESQGHTADAKHYYDKASQSPPDKAWICHETGRLYDRWYAVAEPHGAFNTIRWDDPRITRILAANADSQVPASIEPPAERASKII